MIEVKLGDRYAKSILDLATERGVLEAVWQDFRTIESVCNNNPDFVRMLKNPIVPADKKKAVLKQVFTGCHEITALFINILVDKHREGFLRDVAMRFLFQYDQQKNITRGELVSTTPLSDVQKAAIRKVVEDELQTSFELVERVDPSLIGGFTLRVGDKLFDASISTRLRKLKQEFKKNPYVKQV